MGTLSGNKKINQTIFSDFLFHFIEATVSTGVTREKSLFFTGFAQRKSSLWKSCEFIL
jgi:hypothetical protein